MLDKWLARHPEHTLDTVLTLRDLGVSAFRGANLDPITGELGKFIHLAKQKHSPIPQNSILAIEHLDRFSREEAWLALHVLTDLLKCGLRILTLDPERLVDRTNAGKMEVLLPVVLDLIIAHEASLRKSHLCGDAWARKRQTASEKKLTSRCPHWLRLSKDRTHFEKIPEAVATIKRIWRWALDGIGGHTITRMLNQQDIPTLGKGNKQPTIWLEGTVTRLLTDRALIGEYQPKKGRANHRQAVGDPVPDYFPPIIDKAEFLRVQKRRQLNAGGRKPRHFISLFPRLIRDAHDKSRCILIHKGRPASPGYYRFVSQAGKSGKGDGYRSFPYRSFEDVFLDWTSELSLDDISPFHKNGEAEEQLAGLELQITEFDRQISLLRRKIGADPDLEILTDDVARLVRQRKDTLAELDRIRATIVSPVETVLHDTQALAKAVKTARGEEQNTLRLRLRARIAELVQEIWMLIYDVEIPKTRTRRGNKRQRVADVQVFFRDGGVRQLFVCHAGYAVSPKKYVTLDGKAPQKVLDQDLRNYDKKTYDLLWNWVKSGEDEEFRQFVAKTG